MWFCLNAFRADGAVAKEIMDITIQPTTNLDEADNDPMVGLYEKTHSEK